MTDLFIDDDKDWLIYIQRKFPDAVVTTSCKYAHDIIRDYKIQTVYLDLHIPGVNTADFLGSLKRQHPNVKVIIVSGVELKASEKDAVLYLADGFFVK